MSLTEIISSQQRWARNRWPGHTGALAPSLDENLLFPMTDEVREEYKGGGGNELGTPRRPGKMYSLRSSSALTYNFFAPWRARDLGPLAAALGEPIHDRTLKFEYKVKHGLDSEPPNLDVALDIDQPRPLGVECKFTEPYGRKNRRLSPNDKGRLYPPLKKEYFAQGLLRWTDLGLPKCQELATRVGPELGFVHLDAGQLVKHILGLAWTSKQPPRLMYVWFDAKCDEAANHRKELALFSSCLDSSVEFKERSYQEVFAALTRFAEPIPGYFDYLSARYFEQQPASRTASHTFEATSAS